MSGIWDSLTQFLSQDIIIDDYLSPNIMIFVVCLAHIFLMRKVNKAIDEIVMPPINILENEAIQSDDDSSSIYERDMITHPDGEVVAYKQDGPVKKNRDTMTRIDNILSTTVSEFIRRDLEKMKSKIEAGDHEQVMHTSTEQSSSTEKIYEFLFNEPDMQKMLVAHTEAARHETEVVDAQ